MIRPVWLNALDVIPRRSFDLSFYFSMNIFGVKNNFSSIDCKFRQVIWNIKLVDKNEVLRQKKLR